MEAGIGQHQYQGSTVRKRRGMIMSEGRGKYLMGGENLMKGVSDGN